MSHERWIITHLPHPKPYIFDLINRPIDPDAYRLATTLYRTFGITESIVDGAMKSLGLE